MDSKQTSSEESTPRPGKRRRSPSSSVGERPWDLDEITGAGDSIARKLMLADMHKWVLDQMRSKRIKHSSRAPTSKHSPSEQHHSFRQVQALFSLLEECTNLVYSFKLSSGEVVTCKMSTLFTMGKGVLPNAIGVFALDPSLVAQLQSKLLHYAPLQGCSAHSVVIRLGDYTTGHGAPLTHQIQIEVFAEDGSLTLKQKWSVTLQMSTMDVDIPPTHNTLSCEGFVLACEETNPTTGVTCYVRYTWTAGKWCAVPSPFAARIKHLLDLVADVTQCMFHLFCPAAQFAGANPNSHMHLTSQAAPPAKKLRANIADSVSECASPSGTMYLQRAVSAQTAAALAALDEGRQHAHHVFACFVSHLV